ncbi:MAG: hypothetical protein GTO40_30910, partial [Deltaproteobacteria bacterium]|nr:hypothetical protein [Deltaproteobacteria bacterium]
MLSNPFNKPLAADGWQKPSPWGGGPLRVFSVRAVLSRGLIGLALLISGCMTVGPDYVKPTAEEPKEWIEKEDPKIKSEPADFSQWWTVFED